MFVRIPMYVRIPMCVRVCMRVHVRALMRVRARARVHVLLRVPACRAKASRPRCPHGWAKMLGKAWKFVALNNVAEIRN